MNPPPPCSADGTSASASHLAQPNAGARTSLPRALGARQLLVFIALLVPFGWLVARFWYVCDDAFISFRYARNLASGHGLRYNLTENPPVEGYSNFLWVMLCTFFQRLELDITVWPLVVSVLCGVLLFWLVLDTMWRRLALSPCAAAFAALSLACFPPLALWATAGLETMAFALAVFVTFERLVLRSGGPDALGGGVAALALSLLRFEGLAWAIVILGLAIFSRAFSGERRIRPWVAYSCVLGIGYGVYFAWRYGYFGMPLPNTAYAKGTLDTARLLRGVNYVVVFALTFLTPVLSLPGTILALRRGRRAVGLAVAVMAWAFPAYSIVVTGDFMPMGRFLTPAFAFHAILLGWLLHDLTQRRVWGRLSAALLTAATVALAALPAWNCNLVPRSVRERFHFRLTAAYQSEYERWRAQCDHVQTWTRLGRALHAYIQDRLPDHPAPSISLSAIGAFGYYSGAYVYDRAGLVSPEVAHRVVASDEPLQTPGHDKLVPPDYFRKYDPIFLQCQALSSADPCEIARECERAETALHTRQVQDTNLERYVVDFARAPALDRPAAPAYALVIVRIRDDASPVAARRECEVRRQRLCYAADLHKTSSPSH